MANGISGLYKKPLASLDDAGTQMLFYLRVLKAVPFTIKNYSREIYRLLAEVTLGSGSLAVIGGTIGVVVSMCFFTGTEVGIQGYAALDQLGTAALTGFVSAYFNTREISPIVAGIALAATVGCGFTAQLGAMRISEEIDALEVMAIPSMQFLVTTRVLAGLVAIVPLYIVGLLSSYFATRRHHHPDQWAELWHVRPLLQYISATRRCVVVIRQGADLRRRRHPHPLLLRLLRQWWTCRRGCGRGPRGPYLDRRRQRRRPARVHGDLGHHRHRQIGGLIGGSYSVR